MQGPLSSLSWPVLCLERIDPSAAPLPGDLDLEQYLQALTMTMKVHSSTIKKVVGKHTLILNILAYHSASTSAS